MDLNDFIHFKDPIIIAIQITSVAISLEFIINL
jgi:hypothetical protein